ncbi:MAG: putative NUDIX family phosphoesterase [Planctomycetota bacterium]|jgi:predicted NUDIX family phosphoesterase
MRRAQVFVVDRDAFFGGDWPQGYHRLENSDEFLAKARSLGRFVDREEAEANPAWKQWIPYCMLRCGDWSEGSVDPERGVLAVQRTKKGGEARLHESWSIGLGGHIEPEDVVATLSAEASESGATEARTFFATALGRELSEELLLPAADLFPAPKLLGLINDDSTEVGKVHAGLAYCIDFPKPLHIARETIGIREISKMRGGFTHLVEFAKLWQTRSQFESWSQFLIQAEITVAMGVRSWNGADSAENEA